MRWILLPGFDGTGTLYAPFIRALPSGIVPLVIPYPAHQNCSADKLLGLVLSHLPENEPDVLIAESFSGPLALKASVLHQQPPVALILCASFAKCPLPNITMKILSALGSGLARIRPPRWLVRRYLLGEASDNMVSLFYFAIVAVSPHVLAHRFAVLGEFTGEHLPTHLKSPLLYLQATRDRLISTRNVRFIQQLYPTVQVKKIESPHLILQVEPQASVQAIVDYLAGLAA